jgi:hypothetical protein
MIEFVCEIKRQWSVLELSQLLDELKKITADSDKDE